MKKPKYKFVFMQNRYETICIMGIKRVKVLEKIIDYRGKKFPISTEKPTYVSGNTFIFCIMYESGAQLNFKTMKSSIAPEDLDIIVGQKIIRELTSGVMDNFREKLGVFILGAIIGALIIGMILVIYYSGKIENILTDGNSSNVVDIPGITPVISTLIKGGC